MTHRPEYPVATVVERAGYALLAAATGVGLLAAVVAAVQSQLPDSIAARPAVAWAMCERMATPASTCGSDHAAVVASR